MVHVKIFSKKGVGECMLNPNRYLILTWDELYSDVVKLCLKIKKDRFTPDLIVAIARGGWVIGRIVSDLLGIEEVASIRIRFYVGIEKTESRPILEQPLCMKIKGKQILIVDDVVDTGKTVSLAKEYIRSLGASIIKVAVPYKKPWAKIVPDYYVREVDKWIVFPYEKGEFIKLISEEVGYKGDLVKKVSSLMRTDVETISSILKIIK